MDKPHGSSICFNRVVRDFHVRFTGKWTRTNWRHIVCAIIANRVELVSGDYVSLLWKKKTEQYRVDGRPTLA
jgi:hypothetical protein